MSLVSKALLVYKNLLNKIIKFIKELFMADIDPVKNNIQVEEADFKSPVSEALLTNIGANINFLNQLTSVQEFNSNGTYTVLPGVYWIKVLGIGGGQGGGNVTSIGSHGGNSGIFYETLIKTSPGSTFSVVIGAGGAVGNLVPGTNTSFGSFIFPGGSNILTSSTTSTSTNVFRSPNAIAGGQASSGATATSFGVEAKGQSSIYAIGGTTVSTSGGGGAGLGPGANGGSNAAANTGGGGGGGSGSEGTQGRAGGSGKIIVWSFSSNT